MQLTDFKNKHYGETVYVLGSGKTVEFYDPQFFADKVIVATNDGWSNWLPRVTYMLTKHHPVLEEWCGSNLIDMIFVSRGHCGQHDELIPDSQNYVVFEHALNKVIHFSNEDFPEEGLVVSYSSITSAMHLAAFMGARHIVMVGSDCGWIDGDSIVSGHIDSFAKPDFPFYFDMQNRVVANEIRSRFGCSVSSMLPFVTPNMEGHKFTSPFGALNDS
jgi:hypothetical protein